MTTAIQELRPESLGDAIDFAKACGCEVGDGRIMPALSLVAVEGDQLVAAALCVEQKDDRHRVEVAIHEPQTRADLHRTLVDKTLMKLSSAGIRKFDIRANGSDQQRDFWQAVSWIDQTLNAAPAAPPATPEVVEEATGEATAEATPSKPLEAASVGLGGVDEAA